jgi:putative tributyrin esterase
MNIGTMQFLSRSLGRHVTYAVILPEPPTPGPFPVLIQLHGASDDYTAWLRYSNLVRHLAPYPFLTVLPDGGLSYWFNRSPRERYEDFITQDLMTHVRSTFPVSPGKAAIGGLSMGGFGALFLGLRHPDLFASIWAHSSALFSREERLRMGWTEAEAQEADLYEWVRQVDPSTVPTLSFDCGVDDFLIEQNRAFHRHLESLGISHQYFEHPGAHTWDYWDTHVQTALRQHARVLNLTRSDGEGG